MNEIAALLAKEKRHTKRLLQAFSVTSERTPKYKWLCPQCKKPVGQWSQHFGQRPACWRKLQKVLNGCRESDLVDYAICDTCGDAFLKCWRISPSWLWQRRTLCGPCRYQAYLEYRRVKHDTVACAHCGEMFKQSRSDAKFCSTKCRVYANRAAST